MTPSTAPKLNPPATPLPPHAGMPPLERPGPAFTFFELWPRGLFYLPIFAYWLVQSVKHGSLTLPTAANPGLPAGGLVGESKSAVLSVAGAKAQALIAPFTVVTNRNTLTRREARIAFAHARAAMQTAGLRLPVVAKPDIGCRGAGVRPIRTEEALQNYVQEFPIGARFLLQTMVDVEGEAGVFYIRNPNEERGYIPSLTLKYFPHVVGDGTSTLAELIEADPHASRIKRVFFKRHAARLKDVPAEGERFRLVFSGNHGRGPVFRDGTAHITEALRAKFDEIAKDIPGFYFGRFDVRFADWDEFLAGRGFRIIEFNGAGAEQTHIWDSHSSILGVYKTLFRQYKALFEVAAANKALGAKPTSLRELKRFFDLEARLTPLYPTTE